MKKFTSTKRWHKQHNFCGKILIIVQAFRRHLVSPTCVIWLHSFFSTKVYFSSDIDTLPSSSHVQLLCNCTYKNTGCLLQRPLFSLNPNKTEFSCCFRKCNEARRNWKPQEKFTTSLERCWSIPRTNKTAVDKRHDWDLVGVAIGREFSLWGISDTTTLSPSHLYQVTHCKNFEDWLIIDDFYRYPNYECVSVTWLNDRVLVS